MARIRKAVKVIEAKKADKNHQVVTLTGGDCTYQAQPCEQCPWRSDISTHVFPAEAFRITANVSYDMSDRMFDCHMSGKENPKVCAGFIHRTVHNVALRMAFMRGDIKRLYDTDIPLYEDYREMAIANGVSPDDPVLKGCR